MVYKFICFKHRHVSKRGGHCPTCRNKLYCVGDRARIPRKTDDNGWTSLKDWVILTRNYDPETNEPVGPQSFSDRGRQEDANNIGRGKYGSVPIAFGKNFKEHHATETTTLFAKIN